MQRLTIVIPVLLAFAIGIVCGSRLPSAEAQRMPRLLSARACRVELAKSQRRAQQAEAVVAAMQAEQRRRAEKLEQLEKQIGEMVGDEAIE